MALKDNGKNLLLKLGFLLCQAPGPLLVVFSALFGVSFPLYLTIALMSVAILFTISVTLNSSCRKKQEIEFNPLLAIDTLKFVPFTLFVAALFVSPLPLSHLLVAVGMIALSTGSFARNLSFLAYMFMLWKGDEVKIKNPIEGWSYFFTCNLLYLSSSALIILALFGVLSFSQPVLITLFSLLGLVAILASDVIRFPKNNYTNISTCYGTFAARAAHIFDVGIKKSFSQDFSLSQPDDNAVHDDEYRPTRK